MPKYSNPLKTLNFMCNNGVLQARIHQKAVQILFLVF